MRGRSAEAFIEGNQHCWPWTVRCRRSLKARSGQSTMDAVEEILSKAAIHLSKSQNAKPLALPSSMTAREIVEAYWNLDPEERCAAIAELQESGNLEALQRGEKCRTS